MTVKTLKELIANLPDDMQVILQKDAEGNGYSPLAGVDPDAIYAEEAPWWGSVYVPTWSASDCCMEEAEWEEMKKRPRALVLYPIN